MILPKLYHIRCGLTRAFLPPGTMRLDFFREAGIIVAAMSGEGSILKDTQAAHKEKNPESAEQELRRLLDKNTRYQEEGFTVCLEADAADWDRVIRRLGRKRAYRLMGERICQRYLAETGEEFLFDVRCVAFELQFHFDIYLRTAGFRGYPLHPASLAFSRASLLRHTKDVDVYPADARDLKQRLLFGYRRGVRKDYRGTGKDPFRRR